MANGVRSKYCDARFALPRARFLEGMKLHSRSVLGDTKGELGAVSWHIGRNFPPESVRWIHVAEPFESGNRLFAP
jgi:hypothetical protein